MPDRSVHTSRALAYFGAGLLLLGVSLCGSAATGTVVPPRTAPGAGGGQRPDKPLRSHRLDDLNLSRISREDFENWKKTWAGAGAQGVRKQAATPPPTTPQFVDLTTNQRPPLVGPSTRCVEKHPMWSWDQQYIFLSSNNEDPIGNYGASVPSNQARFKVYRITQDGAFVQQITGVSGVEINGQQEYPAVNHAQTKLAYVGKLTTNDTGQLWVRDLRTGQFQQLTGVVVPNNPLNENLVSVRRPAYDPTDVYVAFAAKDKRIANDPFNIYRINVITRVVEKLTNMAPASGIECIDPTYHPVFDTNAVPRVPARLVFAANCAGVTAGGLLDAALPLPLTDHNLFLMNNSETGADVEQVTTDPADDIEPSFCKSEYPPATNPPAGAYNNWLAWSSKDRSGGTTYDIWFFDFPRAESDTVMGDPPGPVESPQIPPVRLFTPDTNAGAVPLNLTDERYPTWSSSLPPQRPVDRIAFSSNRQNNINDLTKPLVGPPGETDIWGAEVSDITPPTLFMFDETKGEVMRIANAPQPIDPNTPDPGRRIGTAGDTFYFSARLKDLQYGIDSIWAQIKDPDDHFTDIDPSAGGDHKLYGSDNAFTVRTIGGGLIPSHYLLMSWETDYEGIGVNDYQNFQAAQVPDIFSTARYASYSPGVDDSVRWSGNQFPPPINPQTMQQRWLRLLDDGVFPDLVKGDDVFTAQWTTPVNAPSDYYVDLIAYDKAIDPADTNNRSNWIIYDNIWGFSTEPFISQNPVLYVDDYGCGQKWPRGLKGSFRPFPTFRYGTESDIIDRPTQYLPKVIRTLDANGLVYSPATTVPNQLSYLTEQTNFPFPPSTAIRAFHYDVWRILARGPVPEFVMNDYLPTVDEQPLNVAGTSTLQRPVPIRAIFWNAPYTGDIFPGAGSILDQATQDLLRKYRNQSGRLVISGGDLMWALTVDGTATQAFAQDVLGANYLADTNPYPNPPQGDNDWAFLIPAVIDDPAWDITIDVFDSFGCRIPCPALVPLTPLSINTVGPGFFGGNNLFTFSDGTPFQVQDAVTMRAGRREVYFSHMNVVHEARTPANPNATDAKIVFGSFSWASMSRQYSVTGDVSPVSTLNFRAIQSHSMFCWMFSCELVGQILNLNGGAPVPGAWVQAYRGGVLVGSAFSHADGTYAIRGLPVGGIATGGLTIRVDNPGFGSYTKANATAGHAFNQLQLDVYLIPAAPGSIQGKVLDQFNQPVPGTVVQATLQASPLYTGTRDFFGTTGADGRYIIPSTPVGTYVVSVASMPAGFANPVQQFTPPVTVPPAQLGQDAVGSTDIDFAVRAQSGPLTVQVIEQLADGTDGPVIPGAEVTVIDSGGTTLPTQLTDAAGLTSFPNIVAGPATVSAFKFLRRESFAVVNIPQQNFVILRLPEASLKAVTGRVIRKIDGQLIVGPLAPPLTIELRRQKSQQVLRTTAVGPPDNSFIPSTNYFFPDGQDGDFSVAVSNTDPRFLPARVDFTIGGTQNPFIAPTLQLDGRDGTVTGTVAENSAGTPPIGGARVDLISTVVNPGTTVSSVVSQADGTWTTGAPIPSDVYDIQYSAFGYTSAVKSGVFVAGDTDAGQQLLSRAPRGSVFGRVRRALDFAIPNPGVELEIWIPQGQPFGPQFVTSVTTDTLMSPGADGQPANYRAGGLTPIDPLLPEGTYELRVVNDTRYATYPQFPARTFTITGTRSTRLDFDVSPLAGTVTGFVYENDNGAPGQPISNATVRLIRNGQTAVTLTTDGFGRYQTQGPIPPGPYSVIASHPAFFDNSATPLSIFVEGNIAPPKVGDILLVRIPPAQVSGSVRSSVDNRLISGVLVELIPIGAGIPPPYPSTLTAGNTAPNYLLVGASPGNYIIRASRTGWKPKQQSINITAGATLQNINFLLDPEHVFGAGLSLISLPYDTPGVDAAAALERDPNTFKSAYWLTQMQIYSIYPEAAAAEFRLGKGMFVRFPVRSAFTNAANGAPAPDAPFSIPLTAGWNMIGSVRRTRIEWLRVKVSTSNGQILTMQQAMQQGIVANGLWAYSDGYSQSNYMDAFAGYFVKARADCNLIVPVDNTSGALPGGLGARVARLPRMSPAQVERELRAAGLAPGSRTARRGRLTWDGTAQVIDWRRQDG